MSSMDSLKGRSPLKKELLPFPSKERVIKGVRTVESVVHGGIDYSELEALGLKPGEVLDFSANINPFGPPPGLREALTQVDISSYPDSSSSRLKTALADKLGLKPDNIIMGSGSTEIMRLAALAFFKPGDRVLIIEPAFGEYEVSCRIAGVEIIKYVLKTEDNFKLDLSEVTGLVDKSRPKGLFFTNPNNPTGQYYSRNILERLIEAMKGSLIILDEAYISFLDPPEAGWSALDLAKKNNLLILRSMTKDFALAGLRLGYGIARREIISILRNIFPPWNVNAMAQEAGLYAIKSDSYLENSLHEIRKVKAYLIEGLNDLGLVLVPSKANFLLVETGSGAMWRREMLKRKILVRDCASFGLPEYIRISVRTRAECDKLLKAMKEVRVVIPDLLCHSRANGNPEI